MSSLPISYQVASSTCYFTNDQKPVLNHLVNYEDDENHHHQQGVLIYHPSSPNNNNNNNNYHQQHHLGHHPHRSITMNMLHQHQQLMNDLSHDFSADVESVDSCCSPPSSLPLTTNTCTTTTNNNHNNNRKDNNYSFDSNCTITTSSSVDTNATIGGGDDSRSRGNSSFSNSSLMNDDDDPPIFILSPTTTEGSSSISSPPSVTASLTSIAESLTKVNYNNHHHHHRSTRHDTIQKSSYSIQQLQQQLMNSSNNYNTNNNLSANNSTTTKRSSPRDIKPIATTKSAYSLNETKSTQHHHKKSSTTGSGGSSADEGISELEQLFASRRAFNSLSKKYSTDNLLKEQKKRSKHSKDNLLLQPQQPQQLTSTSSFSASSTSTFLEPSLNAIRSTKSSSSLSPNSSIDSFEEIKSIIQAYYNYEAFVESADGREELRLYLRKRHNEEMLLMLETRITFLSFYEEGSNFYVGKRALLKVKEFQMIYSQFIDTNSQFCINIDSAIRNRFVKLNPRVNSVVTEQEASHLVKEIDECLDTLHFSVSLQVKTEIFSQFKKTEEFQTFILSKIIELQGKKAWEDLERQNSGISESPSNHSSGGFFSFLKKNPQNTAIKKFEEKSIEDFLIENELSEYCGQFKKKKLYTLSQIQNYSCDDYLKLGVIKVTHQTRLIRLVGQYFKSYCNKN